MWRAQWFGKDSGRCSWYFSSPTFSCPFSPQDSLSLTSRSEAWFAESQILLGPHPKDPYKRVECLPSSREVRIEVDGTVVAQSTQNTFLYETMLRPRYYLNPTSISDWRYFKRTETRTGCPYKGVAR